MNNSLKEIETHFLIVRNLHKIGFYGGDFICCKMSKLSSLSNCVIKNSVKKPTKSKLKNLEFVVGPTTHATYIYTIIKLYETKTLCEITNIKVLNNIFLN